MFVGSCVIDGITLNGVSCPAQLEAFRALSFDSRDCIVVTYNPSGSAKAPLMKACQLLLGTAVTRNMHLGHLEFHKFHKDPDGAKLGLPDLQHPRVLGMHIPKQFMPTEAIAKACRVVYLCREPKENLVGIYGFKQTMAAMKTKMKRAAMIGIPAIFTIVLIVVGVVTEFSFWLCLALGMVGVLLVATALLIMSGSRLAVSSAEPDWDAEIEEFCRGNVKESVPELVGGGAMAHRHGYQSEGAHMFSYEGLQNQPHKEIEALARYLDVDVTPERIDEICQQVSVTAIGKALPFAGMRSSLYGDIALLTDAQAERIDNAFQTTGPSLKKGADHGPGPDYVHQKQGLRAPLLDETAGGP